MRPLGDDCLYISLLERCQSCITKIWIQHQHHVCFVCVTKTMNIFPLALANGNEGSLTSNICVLSMSFQIMEVLPQWLNMISHTFNWKKPPKVVKNHQNQVPWDFQIQIDKLVMANQHCPDSDSKDSTPAVWSVRFWWVLFSIFPDAWVNGRLGLLLTVIIIQSQTSWLPGKYWKCPGKICQFYAEQILGWVIW